jgi:hypothetical protein
VLVGRPGIGKGSAINPAVSLVRESKTSHLLSDRITIEFLLERMSKGWPLISPGSTNGSISVGFDHTCLVMSRELSVFINASQFTIEILTDLWDTNEEEYLYATRGKGEFRIESPCLNLLGGSTQEWLKNSIPANAVGGGFTRRVNFVLAYDREKLIPWPKLQPGSPVRDFLIQDLREVGRLRGEMLFDVKAAPIFERVYNESSPDEYDDEATTSYKTSKWAQVSKLAMCLSAARGDDLVITKDDIEMAYNLVDKVAKNLLRVFRGVGESDMAAVTDKIIRFLEIKGFATVGDILKSMWRDVSYEDLTRVITTLLMGNVIYETDQGKKKLYALVEKYQKP